jgi:hypothetical protein
LQVRRQSFDIRRPAVLNKVKHLKAAHGVNVIYAKEEQ